MLRFLLKNQDHLLEQSVLAAVLGLEGRPYLNVLQELWMADHSQHRFLRQ